MKSASYMGMALASAFCLVSSVQAQEPEKRTIVFDQKRDGQKSRSDQPHANIVVSASIALVIDASDSIDPVENAQMIEGIKSTLLNGKVNYHECVAITAIRFAQNVHVGDTHIVCSQQDAQDFADRQLSYNPQTKPSVSYNIGPSTMIGAGTAAVMSLFADEKSMGILSQRRAVFFVGDGPNTSHGSLINDIETLASKFGATSYAVPIADRDEEDNDTDATRIYYSANLVTPAGFTYVDRDVYGDTPVGVPPGIYREASDFQGVGKAFEYVLQVGRF